MTRLRVVVPFALLCSMMPSGARAQNAPETPPMAPAVPPAAPAVAEAPQAVPAPAPPFKLPAHLTTSRCMMPVVEFEGALYVFGGQTTIVPGDVPKPFRSDVERINTGDGALTVLTPPLLARSRQVAEVVNGAIYIIGGYADDPVAPFTNRVEKYDPRTGEVKRLNDIPIGPRMAGAAVLGDKIYVLGGGDENMNRLRALQIYDTKKDEWTLGAPMPVAKEGDMVEYGGKLYSVGGYDGKNAVTDFEVYDPAKDEWQKLPDIPVKTSAQYMTVCGDMLYLFGDYASMDRAWGYSFKTGEWRTLPGLPYTPRRHAAVITSGDHVVVIGGTIGETKQIFDTIESFSSAQLQEAYTKGKTPTE